LSSKADFAFMKSIFALLRMVKNKLTLEYIAVAKTRDATVTLF